MWYGHVSASVQAQYFWRIHQFLSLGLTHRDPEFSVEGPFAERGWHDLRKPHIFRASWEEWPSFLSFFLSLLRHGLFHLEVVSNKLAKCWEGSWLLIPWLCLSGTGITIPSCAGFVPTAVCHTYRLFWEHKVCATAVCERNEPGTVAWLQGKQADLINTPVWRNLPCYWQCYCLLECQGLSALKDTFLVLPVIFLFPLWKS